MYLPQVHNYCGVYAEFRVSFAVKCLEAVVICKIQHCENVYELPEGGTERRFLIELFHVPDYGQPNRSNSEKPTFIVRSVDCDGNPRPYTGLVVRNETG